jgi:hypothetical protein
MKQKSSIERLAADASSWKRDKRRSLLDVAAVFDTDKALFNKLSKARLSKAQSQQFPEIAKAAAITKKALKVSQRASVRKAATKKRMSSARMSSVEKYYTEQWKSGQAPQTKRSQLEGAFASKRFLATYLPDLTPEYGKVVRELTKSAPTRSQLRSRTGVTEVALSAILKTLDSKRMIKFRSRKDGRVIQLAPHR